MPNFKVEFWVSNNIVSTIEIEAKTDKEAVELASKEFKISVKKNYGV